MRTTDVYHIIHHEAELLEYVEDWLPDHTDGEKFYGCLFARKKYSGDDRDSVPWMRDQSQLKRFTSDKKDLVTKIRQLETPIGSYVKEGHVIPEHALVLYLMPNPRNLWRSVLRGIKDLADVVVSDGRTCNPQQAVMSTMQRTPGTKHVVDFDIDIKESGEAYEPALAAAVAKAREFTGGKCDILRTRGGVHVFVRPALMAGTGLETTWHRNMSTLADVCGDALMPVPGCIQGGFVPYWMYRGATPYKTDKNEPGTTD